MGFIKLKCISMKHNFVTTSRQGVLSHGKFNLNFKMRIAVFFAFCLTLNNIVGQTTELKPEFNCEELTARIESVKESTRSRKEKFSCILNLLKSALADELENYIDAIDYVSDKTNVTNTEIEKTEDKNQKNVEKDLFDKLKTNDINTQIEENEENEGKDSVEEDLFEKLVIKNVKKECLNNTNWDIPTMIPIFKPKPVIKNVINPEQHLPISKQEVIQANQSPIPKYPAFTIPCQRAADILDMSIIPSERNKIPMREVNLQVKEIMNDVLVPREIISNERREVNVPRNMNLQPRDIVNDEPREINIQPRDINTQPRDFVRGMLKEVKPQSNLNLGAKNLTTNLESPKTLAVHCKDADESVAVLFKPKALTLEQLYGNLLKKLTITVLVPYHMSKLGKMCEV